LKGCLRVHTRAVAIGLLVTLVISVVTHAHDFATTARAQRDTLMLSTYVTVETSRKMATDEAVRSSALTALDAMGISKIYFETSRGCPAIPREEMTFLRDFFTGRGYAVAAGLATHPSQEGFGVRADRGLAWFNYQAASTQEALASVVRDSAAVFDEIIVDDFYCSGDMSPESDAARRGREWGAYRRDLLSGLAKSHIMDVAKAANPICSVIVKFPQWYDLFDVYGYDTERKPQIFDRVFVGAETRGPHTQRFGFTQPYEGFVNYRWIAGQSGAKIGGAWFDFVDSQPEEYVDHAWMSVLAGARELVLFSFPSLLTPDPGLEMLRRDFPALVDLAKAVKDNPAVGVAAYKPANSAAGNDVYLFDHLGMLGIPLVPTHLFPASAPVALLPTQAAADTQLLKKLTLAIKPGRTFVFTPGLLATSADGEALARLAGVVWPKPLAPCSAAQVRTPEGDLGVPRGLDLATRLETTTAKVVLHALVEGTSVPLLTEYEKDGCRFLVLNLRGYGPEDFLATGEYLLSPRELGVIDLPQPATDILRREVAGAFIGDLHLPPRATVHCLGAAGWLVQNFGAAPAALEVGTHRFVSTDTDAHGRTQTSINVNGQVWLHK
jgi:hypothetical protein